MSRIDNSHRAFQHLLRKTITQSLFEMLNRNVMITLSQIFARRLKIEDLSQHPVLK